MADPVVNEFASDAHRRICANLAQPRSIRDLQDFVCRHDPYLPDSVLFADVAQTGNPLSAIVEDLRSEGLVKRIGKFTDGEDLVQKIAEDKSVPTLPEEKAAAVLERVKRRTAYPYPDEEQFLLTEKALERFNAPVPNESPPLEGEALRFAEEANAELAAEGERLAKNGGKR